MDEYTLDENHNIIRPQGMITAFSGFTEMCYTNPFK